MKPSGEDIAGGIALRIAAAGSFSVMAAVLKLASLDGVVAPEMLFYRAFFGLPVVLAWVLTQPGGLAGLTTRRPLAHVGRSALGIVSILCVFQTLTLLPLADATTLSFTAPIFATLLSFLILKEAVGPRRWAAVAVGFIGVLIVMRPGSVDHAVPLEGIGFGLGAMPNALVNMAALSEKYGYARQAYILVSLVGAFLIDFVNALLITWMGGWFV